MNNTQKEEEKSFHNPCPYGNDDCPKCVSTPPADSNWEEEFKSLYEDVLDFPVCCSGGISGDVDCACNGETVKENIIIYIKNLLEQTLQQERQREREEIEKDYIEWVLSSSYGIEYKGRTPFKEWKDKAEARDMRNW